MSDRELPVAPEELLQEIKCKQCNNPLSVSPIRLITEDFVCGRCPGDGLRMKPLEALAKQFQYPCHNHKEGCDVLLTWDEVVQHEENCGFEKIECINKTECCEWIGPKNKLKMHFASNHFNRLILGKNGLIDIKDPRIVPYRFLCTVDDTIFKVEVDSTQNLITCKFIKILSKADVYMYKIHFFNKDTSLVYLRYCSCILTVDQVVLKSVFDNFDDVQVEIVVNTAKKMSIYEKVLPRLECPVCLESMDRNIYTSICGHSVCDKCTFCLQYKCPLCQKNCAFNIRNYALEEWRNSFH